MLSESRRNVLLRQLGAIARKVFDATPIMDAWDTHRIRQEMERLNLAPPQYNVLQGCLNTMVEAGLLKEPERGLFIRAPYREAGKGSANQPIITAAEDANEYGAVAITLHKEQPMPAAPQQPPKQPCNPTDTIGLIANAMRSQATALDVHAKNLREQADKLEECAIQLDDDTAEARQAAETLRAMRALFNPQGKPQ